MEQEEGREGGREGGGEGERGKGKWEGSVELEE